MSENNEKNLDKTEDKKKDFSKEKKEELTVDQKLKDTEDKLLRSLAEIENQRRRFEKEIKDAFEFEMKFFPVSSGLGIFKFFGEIFLNFFDINEAISLNFPLL